MAIDYLINYNDMKSVCCNSAINFSYESGEAEFFLDNENQVQHLRALYDIAQIGNVTSTVDTYARSRDQIFAIYFMTSVIDDNTFEDKDGLIYDLVEILLEKKLCLKPYIVGTGISSTSKNKDLDFNALTKVLNDPECSNALRFGEEGIDYEIVDGRATTGYSLPFPLVNDFITLPSLNQKENCKELLKEEIAQATPAKFAGFFFDSRLVS